MATGLYNGIGNICAPEWDDQLFNGPLPTLITTPGVYTVHDQGGQATAIRKHKHKLSRFEQAKRDLSNGREHEIGDRMKAAYYYTSVPVEMVIDKLGWWNPVACGRPKEFAFKLLLGLPSPASFRSFKWKMCGLTYFLPPVVGRAKSKSRTTVAGIALLKHWSKEFPKFRKFFDAFYNPNAEREITLDCIDFTLGHIPGHFQRTIEANIRKEEERKRKETLALMAMEEQAKMYHMAQAQMQKSTDASAMMQAMQSSGNLTGTSVTATEMLARQQAGIIYQKAIEQKLRDATNATYFSTALGGLK